VRNQFVGGVDLLMKEVGRKESPWIGVGSLFAGRIVVVGRWVGSLWVEVVGRRVVVVVGRMVVVVGVGRVVVVWEGSLLDRYGE
jgi:hypothetical protein